MLRRPEEARILKIIAAIAAVVLAIAVPVAATLLIVAVVGKSSAPMLLLSSFAVMMVTMAPIFAGSMLALSPIDPKLPEGRRYFRRRIAMFVCVQLLGVVGIVAFAVIEGSPWWLPVVITAAGVLLAALCRPVGDSLRRRGTTSPPTRHPNRELTRQERSRKVRRVAITFAVTLVVASAALTAVFFALPAEGDDRAEVLTFAFMFGASFACLAAGLACVVVSWPLVRSLRDKLGSDPREHRLIKRVVIRGKNDELTREQSERAAAYAVVLSDFYPFQIAQLLLLYAALLLQQGVSLMSNPDSELRWLAIGVAILLLVVIIVYLPMTIRHVRRVRRYAAEPRELIDASTAGRSNAN